VAPNTRRTSIVAASCVIASLSACAVGGSTAANGSFCDSMERATALLEPGSGSTTPDAARTRYVELAAVLDAARRTAPPSISTDVAHFATAVDGFATALAAVDHDIDALFRTPEGVRLGEDASHALTPAVVAHLTRECGLALG
jgi:hypothetical protein